jgi:hypothetical protein
MKVRAAVTIEPEIMRDAKALMKHRKFGEFSTFIEALIREAWEKHEAKMSERQGGTVPGTVAASASPATTDQLNETPPVPAIPRQTQPGHYKHRKK